MLDTMFEKNETLKKQKTSFYLNGYYSVSNCSAGLREATGRKKFYENAPLFLDGSPLIAGKMNKALDNEVATCVVNSNQLHYDRLEQFLQQVFLDEETKRTTQKQFDELQKTCVYRLRSAMASGEEKLVEESGAALAQGYNGHFGYDYGFVLNRGLDEVKSYIQRCADIHGANEFYQALLITTEGMQTYIYRHKLYAESLLADENMRKEFGKDYLEKVASVCGNIAFNKPADFHEAVQLQWFLMMFTDYDSFARYDQYMLTFYQNEKNISGAKDIFKGLLIRLNEGGILNMTIGGLTPDGKNAVNDLTLMILQATREMKFRCPNLCLRINKFTTDEIWKEAGESLATGQALPALYNDDAIIPMLLSQGISELDANNYTLAGCSQAVIPGKSNFNCDVGLYTPAKMLELALHNGFDTRIQKQVGPKTGEAISFNSYEEFYSAYRNQMVYCVEKGAALNNQDVRARRDFLSCVRTIMIPECIEKGIGILQGGATYNCIQGEVIGLTNTANALIAVKKLIFEEKKITMEQLLQALNANFAGFENIRTMLLSVPKFGNDITEVDDIRSEITRDFFTQLSSQKAELGGVHWGGEVIFNYHISMGVCTGALPDGRFAYTPLADSAGPTQGSDTEGLTAILHSVSKLPFNLPATSINLNLKFPKNLWHEQKSKILTAFQTYFAMGGGQLQVNVLDAKALRDALDNPAEHKNIVVRVGGFSAYFVELDRDLQEEIISRTEQSGISR